MKNLFSNKKRSKNKIYLLGVLTLVLFPFVQIKAVEFNEIEVVENILEDEDLVDSSSMTLFEIRNFLKRGTLETYKTKNFFGEMKFASEIIHEASNLFSINPKFVLTMLQKEQSLIESQSPSSSQLDWAMGYGICDDCSHSDSQVQVFRGFGKQVYFALKRIRESYLSDLEKKGKTETGIGPNKPIKIDGKNILLKNNANAVLFTYTPHTKGNISFKKIWNAWFYPEFPTGSLLQDKKTGAVFFISKKKKHLISSKSTLYSRFPNQKMNVVNSSLLNQYENGPVIKFPNYSILRSPKGHLFLIDGETRRGFSSKSAFVSHGFKEDDIVNANWDEIQAYKEVSPVEESTKQLLGIFVQEQKTGAVFFAKNGKLSPVISKEILKKHLKNQKIYPLTKEFENYPLDTPLLFSDGVLVKSKNAKDVFYISDGLRRPIANDSVFAYYGWKFEDVIETDEKSLLLHPLGEILSGNPLNFL